MGCNTSQDLKKTVENHVDAGAGNGQHAELNSSATDVHLEVARSEGSANGKLGSSTPKKCETATVEEFEDEAEFGSDEEQAATRIQAVFRGHQVRTTMKKSDDETATAPAGQEPTEAEPTKEELEAEFDPNDKELCGAAMKIQATFRGHLQRKILNKENEDVDIDEITKKVAEELDIDLTDPKLNEAATKIQASFRGHKTRKDVVGTE